MHIAIDNRLSAYRVGGIPHYTNQLLTALAEIAPPDVRFTSIDHRKPPLAPVANHERIAHRRVWTPPHNRWEQTLLPYEIRGVRADILHFPDYIPLFNIRTPTAITVHDLAFLRFPGILDDAARRYYGQIGRALRRADAIIAVSESTKSDLVELLHVDPARVNVVYEAASTYFQPLLPAADSRTINGYTLQRNEFALFVGTVEPRKNLAMLLHALREMGTNNAPLLVVAGARGWLDDPIFQLVEQLELRNFVRFLGAVSQPELVWLYNACRVYLHPELYSGFGLPVLEAMQCGAPALVAQVSSLPEIAGDAAWLVPPDDPSAWADAWQRIWHDEALRADFRTKGLAQAARFSWERAGQETLAIYRRLRA